MSAKKYQKKSQNILSVREKAVILQRQKGETLIKSKDLQNVLKRRQ